MGLLGKIGKVIVGGVVGGPTALAEITIGSGSKVIKGVVDVGRQIVEIGTDVYKEIPPEAFFIAGQPLHGLLKHVKEDELILLGQTGADIAIFGGLYWAAAGPIGASLAIAQGAVPLYVAVGSLVGKIHHRLLNDEEWEMARYIFRGSLYDRSSIILTNLAGKDGRAFTIPSTFGPVLVNCGNRYVHDKTIRDGPVLFHELTHVWQAKQRLLREIFLYDALPEAVLEHYNFTPGQQWSEYGTEQQASIVEAWTRGATERKNLRFDIGSRDKFALGSPLFRYINANVRRSDSSAATGSGRSVRRLLSDGKYHNFKEMYSNPPTAWWKD